MRRFVAQCWLPADVATVFDYCRSNTGFREQFPFALRWLDGPELWRQGDTLDFRYRWMGLWLHHRATITDCEPSRRFTDVMEQGLYQIFRHHHEFEPERNGTRVTDTVEFTLGLGDMVDCSIGLLTLRRAFRHRHQALQARFAKESQNGYQNLS